MTGRYVPTRARTCRDCFHFQMSYFQTMVGSGNRGLHMKTARHISRRMEESLCVEKHEGGWMHLAGCHVRRTNQTEPPGLPPTIHHPPSTIHLPPSSFMSCPQCVPDQGCTHVFACKTSHPSSLITLSASDAMNLAEQVPTSLSSQRRGWRKRRGGEPTLVLLPPTKQAICWMYRLSLSLLLLLPYYSLLHDCPLYSALGSLQVKREARSIVESNAIAHLSC